MNNKIKNKIDILVKSMRNSVKKITAKDIISDVMDSDRTAEIASDDIPKARTGVLSKTKDKDKDEDKEDIDKCEGISDCDCECDGPVEKGEKFVKDFMNGFEKISKAYLMEKAKIDDGLSATDKKKFRKERNEDYKPNKRSIKGPNKGMITDPKRVGNEAREDAKKNTLKDKQANQSL